MLDRCARCVNADRFAVEPDRAAAERIDTEDSASKLRASGTDEPGET
jgi:hypothetical protein